MKTNKTLLLTLALTAASCAPQAYGMNLSSWMNYRMTKAPVVEQKIERNIKQEWEYHSYKKLEIQLPEMLCPYGCNKPIKHLLTFCIGYDSTGDCIIAKGNPCHENDTLFCDKAQEEPKNPIIFAYNLRTGISSVHKLSEKIIMPDPKNDTDYPTGCHTYRLRHDTQGLYSYDRELAQNIYGRERTIAIDNITNDVLKNVYNIIYIHRNIYLHHSSTKNVQQNNAIIAQKTQNDHDIALTVFGVNPCKPLCTLIQEPINTAPLHMCDADDFRTHIFVNDNGTEIYWFDAMALKFSLFKLFDKAPNIRAMPDKDTCFRFK